MASNPVLAEYVRVSKYALHIGQRRETWPEQVDRVFDMHATRYGEEAIESVRAQVDHAYGMMLDMMALGSQRILQFGGTPVLRRNQRVYNCTVSHCNRPRFFQEAFHLLLCGCGVGFSVQRHHVARLPRVVAPQGPSVVFQIPDTIEGWADAFGVLLSSYFVRDQPFPEYAGRRVTFDASLVRPKGAPISSGSKAPGPAPLLRALESARLLLDRVVGTLGEVIGIRTISDELSVPMIGQGRDALRPIDAFDLVMFAADAVLSGGVRRSATIALFSADDIEMIEAKAADRWWDFEPQRKRANISAVLLRQSTDFATFSGLVARTKGWGEPGFIFTDDLELVCNPCVEIGMWPCLEVNAPAPRPEANPWAVQLALAVEHGLFPGSASGVEVRNGTARLPGWQMCNLTTMNGSACVTPELFFGACRAAATLGTLQAGYTTFEYLGHITEAIVRKEALLGVSVTGMMDQPDVLFDPAVLEAGAAIVKAVNEEVALALGINPAARTTCVKPEGKSSLILDTLAAGIHPWHSKRGIRHVRASILEAPFQHLKAVNPHAVFELGPSDPNRDNTQVIAFPFEAPDGALTANEVTARDLLERVILVRRHWVEPGTRPERCVRPWLRHNVSNTITVQPDEWDEVTRFIFDNRDDFAGVAMLPASGDKFYDLAPNVAVHTPDEQVAMYGAATVREAVALVQDLPASFAGLWPAVGRVVNTGATVEALTTGTVEECEWMGRFIDFAMVRCGDGTPNVTSAALRAAEVRVKDAELWARYTHIKDNFVPVDWSTLNEVEDGVDHLGNSGACDGTRCELDLSQWMTEPTA
jgi:ribonucleoside-diphosphate reductase alpha chain